MKGQNAGVAIRLPMARSCHIEFSYLVDNKSVSSNLIRAQTSHCSWPLHSRCVTILTNNTKVIIAILFIGTCTSWKRKTQVVYSALCPLILCRCSLTTVAQVNHTNYTIPIIPIQEPPKSWRLWHPSQSHIIPSQPASTPRVLYGFLQDN